MDRLISAIECFCQGFTYTRSFTFPYVVDRYPGIWVMRDETKRKWDTRNSEFVVYGLDPDEAVERIRPLVQGRFYICALSANCETDERLKSAYKGHHFRLLRREPMFECRVGAHHGFQSEYQVERVTTKVQADKVARAAGSQQILPGDIGEGDRRLRLYAAYAHGEPVGWVRSIRTESDSSWVSNMFVKPEHRRQGIGRALMACMLDDDGKQGVRRSVLLASEAGTNLYPVVGYEQIGLLYIFSPNKDIWNVR